MIARGSKSKSCGVERISVSGLRWRFPLADRLLTSAQELFGHVVWPTCEDESVLARVRENSQITMPRVRPLDGLRQRRHWAGDPCDFLEPSSQSGCVFGLLGLPGFLCEQRNARGGRVGEVRHGVADLTSKQPAREKVVYWLQNALVLENAFGRPTCRIGVLRSDTRHLA